MSGPGIDLHQLAPTEQINPRTQGIDLLSVPDILKQINDEDRLIPEAVSKAIPQIAIVVEKTAAAFHNGGRLFYIGAGTSGRLGVLDASECPPTFGTDPDLVQGIIAGGETALRNAVEGAEDDPDAGKKAIEDADIGNRDILVGISASGGAAYVVEAIKTARALGAFTGAVTSHSGSALAMAADVAITVETGPEALAGSTRMKAGTAQKLVLNMITTGAMIAWGKTYRNLMVDLKPTNLKLKARAIRLVSMLADQPAEKSESALAATGGKVKPAVVMLAKGVDLQTAEALLENHRGKLRSVLETA